MTKNKIVIKVEIDNQEYNIECDDDTKECKVLKCIEAEASGDVEAHLDDEISDDQ